MLKHTYKSTELLNPFFKSIYAKYSQRTIPGSERIKSFKRLENKMTSFLGNAESIGYIYTRMRWEELHRSMMKDLSPSSQRILTQDLNTISVAIAKSEGVTPISLKAPQKKSSASPGFGVNELLHFNSSDILSLWKTMQPDQRNDFSLLFLVIICSCMHPEYLLRARISDLTSLRNGLAIVLTKHYLLCSIIAEPAATLLLRYILCRDNLAEENQLFPHITIQKFKKWLKKKCRQAGVPNISPEQLVKFGKFALDVGGVKGYLAAALGGKNIFSPLLHTKERDRNE